MRVPPRARCGEYDRPADGDVEDGVMAGLVAWRARRADKVRPGSGYPHAGEVPRRPFGQRVALLVGIVTGAGFAQSS